MIEHDLYLQELKEINRCNLPWEMLNNRKILITGATGLIGSVLVDSLIYRNEYLNAGIHLFVLGRSKESLKNRFKDYSDKEYFHFLIQSVETPIDMDAKVDYIIHAAGNGDPSSFALDPVGVMNANYIGMYQILELARNQRIQNVLYVSSGEVYGEVKRNTVPLEGLKESNFGFVDTLNSRSCYANSKRAAETLCASYYHQYKINFNIGRPSHTYGPSMQEKDSRVICEFFRRALKRENITMKSAGTQIRSYCYAADTVKGLLYILLLGMNGEAYNIANKNSVITIRGLAEKTSKYSQSNIIYEKPDDQELKGFSNIQHAILDASKLEKLGWSANYDLDEGISRTLEILTNIN